MDGDVQHRAAYLVEQEATSAVESARIVEQLTANEERTLVIAVETTETTYWVVEDPYGQACYSSESYASADAVLLAHLTHPSQ